MMDSKKFKCIVCDSFLEVDSSGEYISPCEKCLNQLYDENSDAIIRDLRRRPRP
jgi:transcription initiation factor IIE alpha subunit